MRKITAPLTLALLAVLALAPAALAAVPAAVQPDAAQEAATETAADVPVLEDAAESLDAAPQACSSTAEPSPSLLAEADFSCLVCWRDRDCNTYCGGPWGDCYRGCCACTQ